MTETHPSNIYERMLTWPLFLGLSTTDLRKIAANVRFAFHKHYTGDTILLAGSQTSSLRIVINGKVMAATRSDKYGYTIEEELTAPLLIEPERLYGLSQNVVSTYTALTDSGSVEISKSDVSKLAIKYEIIHINLLNIISTYGQRQRNAVWNRANEDILMKFIDFIKSRSRHVAGRKCLKITMQQLADQIAESRLNTSKMLHLLKEDGLIRFTRNKIDIMSLDNLAAYSKSFDN